MVVDDEAVLLLGVHVIPCVGETPVHAGDGLEQAVLAQRTVEVERLLDRRIEAGQQHIDDDENLRLPLWVDKGVGNLVAVELARRLELRAVVGSRCDDRVGAQAKVVQMSGVAQRGCASRSDDLRLEAVWADLRLEVVGDVQGDHLDAPRCPGYRLLVGVAAAYPHLHIVGLIAEQRVEQHVQRLRPVDGQLGQPRLVPDGDRGAVGFTDCGIV